MLRYNLVGKIRRNSTKEVEALDVPLWGSITAIPNDSSTTLQTGNLWAYAPNGSLWVHRNAVICVPPEMNNHFIITILTPKGESLITVLPSTNGSTCLVSIHKCVVRTRSTYQDIFRTYIYSQQ